MPLRNLRIEGNVRWDDRNIDRNPALPYAPAEQFSLAGIGYGSVATSTSGVFRNGQLTGRAYDRREDIGQLRLSWMIPRLSWSSPILTRVRP
jgi:hypothetical protein